MSLSRMFGPWGCFGSAPLSVDLSLLDLNYSNVTIKMELLVYIIHTIHKIILNFKFLNFKLYYNYIKIEAYKLDFSKI